MNGPEAAAFERCMSVGGVAVFPSDTVYGLACDVHNKVAVQRLYGLKRRSPSKPAAVMFFDLELALAALPELGPRTRGVFERLLPGGVTLLVNNPAGRFELACGDDRAVLGVRVPVVPTLAGVQWPVLQSSANIAGGPEASTLKEVDAELRRAADIVIDGGELPGTASTVVDLRSYEDTGAWHIVREGAVAADEVHAALHGHFHFNPVSYMAMIRDDIPVYDEFQDALADACGDEVGRVLELGTGTGETAARVLERNPSATLIGVDESAPMLAAARERLGSKSVELRVRRLQEPLPQGPFDVVASALCVHHLDGDEKRDLFGRVRRVLKPGGRFVLGDVIVPEDPANAVISLTPDFDRPGTLDEQLGWLREAGFECEVTWLYRDLAVVCATARGEGSMGAP